MDKEWYVRVDEINFAMRVEFKMDVWVGMSDVWTALESRGWVTIQPAKPVCHARCCMYSAAIAAPSMLYSVCCVQHTLLSSLGSRFPYIGESEAKAAWTPFFTKVQGRVGAFSFRAYDILVRHVAKKNTMCFFLQCQGYVSKMLREREQPDKTQISAGFVFGGPGVGKSRLLTKLAQWIPEHLDAAAAPGAGAAGASAQAAVVVFIKASNGQSLLDYEMEREDNCASTALACRILHSVFCPGVMAYTDFVRDICGGSSGSFTISDVLLLIAYARKQSGLSTHFSLVVLCDEAQCLTRGDKRYGFLFQICVCFFFSFG